MFCFFFVKHNLGSTKTRTLWQNVLSCKANLSIYWSVHVPHLLYGHGIWSMIEKMSYSRDDFFLLGWAGSALETRISFSSENGSSASKCVTWGGFSIWKEASWIPLSRDFPGQWEEDLGQTQNLLKDYPVWLDNGLSCHSRRWRVLLVICMDFPLGPATSMYGCVLVCVWMFVCMYGQSKDETSKKEKQLNWCLPIYCSKIGFILP